MGLLGGHSWLRAACLSGLHDTIAIREVESNMAICILDIVLNPGYPYFYMVFTEALGQGDQGSGKDFSVQDHPDGRDP
jgi:hypothetical protein